MMHVAIRFSFLAMCMISLSVSANSTQNISNEYRKEIENFAIRTRNNTEVKQFIVEHSKNDAQKWLEENLQPTTRTGSNPSILIFVSFSMPKASIENYLQDAKKIGASVVIRGLIDNSFKKTMQEMAGILEKTGYGFELNPIWFKKFSIKSVPSFVFVSDKSNCMKHELCNQSEFDVVHGNSGLLYALQQTRSRSGMNGKAANDALEKLRSKHA